MSRLLLNRNTQKHLEGLLDVLVLLGRALDKAAEIVIPRELLQKLFGLVHLRLLVIDEVGLVLDQKAGDFDIGPHVGVFLDGLLPLQRLLYGASLVGGADDGAAYLRAQLPSAPRRYILETELNLSCPAMSHSCSRTALSSTLDFSLVEKSQPMVGLTFSSNLWWTYW